MLILIRDPLAVLKSWLKSPLLCKTGARFCAALGLEEAALWLVERALREYPQRTDLNLHAGQLCFKLGRIERAVWHIKRLWSQSGSGGNIFHLESITSWPGLPKGLKDRGWILAAVGSYLLSCGEPGRALSYFNRALAAGLGYSTILNQKGLCLLSLGRVEEALKFFQEARAAGGRDAGLLLNTALALNRLGRYAEALECYEKAQRLGADGANLLNNKGFSLFNLRRYDEAACCFELAQEMEPQSTTARANLAVAYVRLGRIDEALAILTALVEKDPEDGVLLNNLAVSLEAAGRRLEALALYKKAVALGGPESHTFFLNQAACLAGLERFDEALAIFEHLAKVVPEDRRIWSLKASILAELGRRREAADCYRRALGLTG
ncbi:MAG: tetratricopeptide repeat protein [Bacillota bacterium]